MNSPVFEPRRVAASAPLQWIRQAAALIARAPLGFGLILVMATVVDRVVFRALAPIATPAHFALIGALLYWPLLAAAIVVARAADLSGPATHGARLWRWAIGAAVIAAGLCAIGVWLPASGHAVAQQTHSLWPLAVLWGSLASYLLGTSFLPLMAFSPASRPAVLALSWRAHRRNLQPSVSLSLVVMLSSTVGACLLPAALAAIVVAFHGALFYVAYREIFEGRARNAEPVVQPAVSVAVVRMAPCKIPSAGRRGSSRQARLP
ncbi:MAG TPA: hypothetical protein VFB36_16245 [Nevskiaceae bacterium]|nr:hypothetical protein [Nevskiaceae bacterium]